LIRLSFQKKDKLNRNGFRFRNKTKVAGPECDIRRLEGGLNTLYAFIEGREKLGWRYQQSLSKGAKNKKKRWRGELQIQATKKRGGEPAVR